MPKSMEDLRRARLAGWVLQAVAVVVLLGGDALGLWSFHGWEIAPAALIGIGLLLAAISISEVLPIGERARYAWASWGWHSLTAVVGTWVILAIYR